MDIITSLASNAWLLTLIVTAGVVAIVLAARFMAAQQRQILDNALVRRELIDECFAKGQMTKGQCEAGRKTDG